MKPLSENRQHESDGDYTNEFPHESLFQEYVAIILRGRWTILITLVAMTSLVALYVFTAKPIYEASSLVLIDIKGKEGAMAMFDITGTGTANKITNELEILKSNANADAVARALLARKHLDHDSTKIIQIIQSAKKMH